MAHSGADGVHRAAVVQASIGLRQVLHHKFGLPLVVPDLIVKRLPNGRDLLLKADVKSQTGQRPHVK